MVIMGSAEKVRGDFFKRSIEPETWQLLKRVNAAIGRGTKAYVVGGFLRDVLLGRETVDIDIAVGADALDIAPQVAEALGGRYVLLDRENGVGRVVLAGEGAHPARGQQEIDFSTFAGPVEQDLGRRDFTINAMAVDLQRLVQGDGDVLLVDPFQGREDLERRVIRSVSETAFESDPVRLLRAVRLAAELGFYIDEKTEKQVRKWAHLLARAAGERVREEFLRLLGVSGSGKFVSCLDGLGLLTAMMPELADMKGVKQPKEHYWDVFEHSVKTVLAIDFLLREGDWDYSDEALLAAVPWSERLVEHFDSEVSGGSTRRVLLKVAALLHDIAKPQTKAFDANGRMRFLGHGKEGASMAAHILERLRFSSREIRLVETVVTHHLRPMQMSQDELPTQRAIYRYFRDTGETGIDILFMSLADHLATRGPDINLSHWQEHARMVEYVLDRYYEQERVVMPVKLVDGHDLLNIFGMSPGPEVGRILEAVREAQASGELSSRQEALAYIRERLLVKGNR